MNAIQDIKDSLVQIAQRNTQAAQVFTAEVVETGDDVAKVQIGDFVISGVKLFSIDAAGGLLVKPQVGSKVTVVDMSNGKLRDLAIIKVDTPELIRWTLDNMTGTLDGVEKKATLTCDTLEVELDGAGKIAVSASGVSLKDLMTQVATIIKGLTVSTPAGPSGTPLPPTLQAVMQYETDISTMFK